MRIYLFRHAERDSFGATDPSLSSRGQLQAEKILSMIRSNEMDRPDRLWVSPRKRSQQTFSFLSQHLTLEASIIPALDERQNSESAYGFNQRVRRVISDVASIHGTTFVCSHLDWIEEALPIIPCTEELLSFEYQAWEPGRHMIFDIEEGLWHLRRFGGIQV